VDVGSIEFLHRRLLDERDKGTPVVIVSTELDEVVQLADRIAVMSRGGILGIVPGDGDGCVWGVLLAVGAAEAAREAGASGAARTSGAQLGEGGVGAWARWASTRPRSVPPRGWAGAAPTRRPRRPRPRAAGTALSTRSSAATCWSS